MNRRDFLKILGLGTVTVAAPKFIFDLGANLYKRQPMLVTSGTFGGIDIIRSKCGITDTFGLTKSIWEEKLFRDTLKETYFVRLIEPREVDLILLELNQQ